MKTKEITMSSFSLIHQGKPAEIFGKLVDFAKFMMSNYGKYLGINRKMKTNKHNVCHRRSDGSLNTQEWSL